MRILGAALSKRTVGSLSGLNPFGVALLPEHLRSALFGSNIKVKEEKQPQEIINRAKDDLLRFGLLGSHNQDDADTTTGSSFHHLELPKLCGDVEQHFYHIAQQQINPYLSLLDDLVIRSKSIPETPTEWSTRAGWTRYNSNSNEAVDHPEGGWIVFDVEVCVRHGPQPVLATALSQDGHWYSWVSPRLFGGSLQEDLDASVIRREDLIRLGKEGGDDDDKAKIVVGHNVSYDRARMSDNYDLRSSGMRFVDTMSLHVAASGMTSGQRMIKQQGKSKKNKSKGEQDTKITEEEAALFEDELLLDNEVDSTSKVPKWFSETSLNNLADVYQLYCPGEKKLDKATRDIFVEGTMQDVKDNFQILMAYCASDVLATRKLAAELFPVFRSRCPHPATLSGMLEMSTAKLTVDRHRWKAYVDRCDSLCQETEDDVSAILGKMAKEACQLMVDDKYKSDPWLQDEDWSARGIKLKKATDNKNNQKRRFKTNPADEEDDLRVKFLNLLGTSSDMFKKQPPAPGYPRWYQDQISSSSSSAADPLKWRPHLPGLTASKILAPKLLRLTWMGQPLYRHEKDKWGYLVAAGENSDNKSSSFQKSLSSSNEESDTDVDESVLANIPDYSTAKKNDKYGRAKKNAVTNESASPRAGFAFHRLPHKDGGDKNVGNPLAKDFLGAVKQGVLATSTEGDGQKLADRVLRAGKSISYWRSSQDRIKSQMLVPISEDSSSCVILPQMVTAGTLTRRAVERTWLTASNAKSDRIGSELKSLVQAPEGYHIVGADVDSQELWISAVLGDASHPAKEHGCTPLGWMTLRGAKQDGTDMHSQTAKTVGVSRDEAKVLNYGRIYGAGVSFAKTLLRRFNPSLEDSQARKLAVEMYQRTKGDRLFVLNELGAFCLAGSRFRPGCASSSHDSYVGYAVDKREISRCVKFYRKLSAHFVPNKPKSKSKTIRANDKLETVSWAPKNRDTEDIMLHMGIEFEDNIPSSTVMECLSQMGSSSWKNNNDNNTNHYSDWTNAVNKLTSSSLWYGGAESHTFNRLEKEALDFNAKTPVLSCRISRALDARVVGSDYLPSRINWVVQSSAVDYLHLLLVAMRWACQQEQVEARYLISIHDEVRYLVPSHQRYRAARCLHQANMLVRAMFCSRLQMGNMPEAIAYFSAVDVDTVMRKDPLSDCVTPSQPEGLEGGFGIKRGECLDAFQADQKARAEMEEQM